MATAPAGARVPPAPSLDRAARATISVTSTLPDGATAIGVPVASSGPVPDALGVDRRRLKSWGFDGAVGSTFVVPASDGRLHVAGGVGDPSALDSAAIRHAAAAFARAAAGHDQLAISLERVAVDVAAAVQATVEGVLLARYRYDALRSAPGAKRVRRLALVVQPDDVAAARLGAKRGQALAGATMLARDLANSPHNHLSASRMAEIASRASAPSTASTSRSSTRGLWSRWGSAACSASMPAALSRRG